MVLARAAAPTFGYVDGQLYCVFLVSGVYASSFLLDP
jgi:hypothetical protein